MHIICCDSWWFTLRTIGLMDNNKLNKIIIDQSEKTYFFAKRNLCLKFGLNYRKLMINEWRNKRSTVIFARFYPRWYCKMLENSLFKRHVHATHYTSEILCERKDIMQHVYTYYKLRRSRVVNEQRVESRSNKYKYKVSITMYNPIEHHLCISELYHQR